MYFFTLAAVFGWKDAMLRCQNTPSQQINCCQIFYHICEPNYFWIDKNGKHIVKALHSVKYYIN